MCLNVVRKFKVTFPWKRKIHCNAIYNNYDNCAYTLNQMAQQAWIAKFDGKKIIYGVNKKCKLK